MTKEHKVGARVHWKRSGAPFGGAMTGYVTKVYDHHGVTKYNVRSNGRTYAVLHNDLSKKEIPFQEEVSSPTNSAGSGGIAGIGQGPDGEPGVTKKNKKKIILRTFRRWMENDK